MSKQKLALISSCLEYLIARGLDDATIYQNRDDLTKLKEDIERPDTVKDPLLYALELSFKYKFMGEQVMVDVISDIISKGEIDIGSNCYAEHSFLKFAIAFCSSDVVRLILKSKIRVNVNKQYDDIPLLIAVSLGRLDVVSTLLTYESNIDVNVSDHLGFTPLTIAIQNFERECYDTMSLVNMPKEFLAAGNSYYKPFQKVTAFKIIKKLLNFGADANSKYNSRSVLAYSLEINSLEFFQELILCGANIDECATLGEVILDLTATIGKFQILEPLLKCQKNYEKYCKINELVQAAAERAHTKNPLSKYAGNPEILETFRSWAEPPLIPEPVPPKFHKQVIKYCMLKFLKETDVALNYLGITECCESCSEVLNCILDCKAELARMTDYKLENSLTLHDVVQSLMVRDIKIAEYGIESLDKICLLLKENKFPIYANCIILSLHPSVLAQKVVELQMKSMPYEHRLNYEMAIKMASYLSNADLINWISALESL